VLSAGVRRDLTLRSERRFGNGVVQATDDVTGHAHRESAFACHVDAWRPAARDPRGRDAEVGGRALTSRSLTSPAAHASGAAAFGHHVGGAR